MITKQIQINLSQSSTSAPTIAATFRNSVGTLTLAYSSTGTYTVVITGAFTSGKTRLSIQSVDNSFVSVVRTDADTLTIKTRDNTGTLANGILSNTQLSVEILP